ncbi:Fe-S cluster assembly protein SufD [Candidatus Woesearchaeota archaeon]|nr:Fe-S cluster assembly protein SufD [Candidatus Woesearchaeota archaeon]
MEQQHSHHPEPKSSYASYQETCRQQLSQFPPPSYRYGLNILIAPKHLDFTALHEQDQRHQQLIFTLHYPTQTKATITDDPLHLPEHASFFFTDDWIEPSWLGMLHHSHTHKIVMITAPKNAEATVELVCDLTQGSCFTTFLIHAQQGAKARIVLIQNGGQSKDVVSTSIRVHAEQGSTVDIVTIQDLDAEANNLREHVGKADKDACINWLDLSLGSSYTRTSVITHLVGDGSTTNNTALFLAKREQRIDLYTASLHEASHTSSNILTKGVVDGHAKVLSRGLVSIASNAFGSSGYEKQNALLLSDTAEADAIPNLEIHNHDVKCTHGSTIGQLDQEKVFYLMSRGLSRKEAQQQLIEGYFAPVLSEISNPDLRASLITSIQASLHAETEAGDHHEH